MAAMKKLKSILFNWKVLLMLCLLAIAIWQINPNFTNDGVAIRSVMVNSSASESGIHQPLPTDKPMSREVITELNGKKIKNIEEYNEAISKLEADDILKVKTKSNFVYKNNGERSFSVVKKTQNYNIKVRPTYDYIITNKTETKEIERVIEQNETIKVVELIDGKNVTTKKIVSSNKTITEEIEVPIIETKVTGVESIGLKVYNAPKTNIRKGLDLEGGTRVILQPETELSQNDMDIIIENLNKRLNLYGLNDISIRETGDLSGNQFISVEVAGANEDEVKNLISGQGKFEAKVGNVTVFSGGDDIKFVCRSGECAYAVDPRRPCGTTSDGNHVCSFMFSITLSTDAAKQQAETTKDLKIVDGEYLSQSLELYLDDQLVDSLRIGKDLKGKPVTDIAISGSGIGATLEEAKKDSAKNMKELQTVLITGSLPVKLNIVKIDTVSPALGKEFLDNAILIGLVAMLAVSVVIFLRYRMLKISIPILITMIAEVIFMLGFAAVAGWNLDLAAMAGIIIAIGTGVDHQIVITDQAIGNKKRRDDLNWKDKIKNAFEIIFVVFATMLVAMIPLTMAGAGLLKGFALTTIVGFAFGVFFARPAFAVMIEKLLKD